MGFPTLPTGSGWPGRGIFRCDDATYHAMPGISSTRIKRCADSMRAFREQFTEDDEDTDAKRYGRGFHCLALEGRDEFARRFIVAPSVKLTSKEAKAEYAAWGNDLLGDAVLNPSMDAETLRSTLVAGVQARGGDVVEADWLATMDRMYANAMANPNIAALLTGDGLNEICLFDEWTGEDADGEPYTFKARGKLDRVKVVGKQTIGLDFKTMPEFGPGLYMGEDDNGQPVYRWPKVERYARDYMLPIPCRWYERLWDGLADIHGMPPLLLTFAMAEKQGANRALWTTPSRDSLATAGADIDRWLSDISRCKRTRTWPGVPVTLHVLDV